MSVNVYQIITDRILAKLKDGIVPWRQPWAQGEAGMPKNLVSGKPYRGVNIFLLGSQRFSSPYFCTYKQATEKGGNVRKGQQGTPVVFWKVGKKDGATDAQVKAGKGRYFILRYYTVFNVTQCEGLDVPGESQVQKVFNPIEECEKVVASYTQVPVIHGGGRACYIPSLDQINMPDKESFDHPEAYYATLMHEVVHSTGAKHRLDRAGVTDIVRFGSHNYSFEELIAEMGSAFLCNHCGILDRTLDNSVAYIQSWAAKLRSEPQWVIKAGSAAQKAADFVLGRKAQSEEESEDEAA